MSTLPYGPTWTKHKKAFMINCPTVEIHKSRANLDELIPWDHLVQIAITFIRPASTHGQCVEPQPQSKVNQQEQTHTLPSLKQNWKRMARTIFQQQLGAVISEMEEVSQKASGVAIKGSNKDKRGRMEETSTEISKKACTKEAHSNKVVVASLKIQGSPFTWNNKRDKMHNVREKLDRAVASPFWSLLFPNATLLHLEDVGLDHHPLLLDTELSRKKLKQQFQFDVRWVEKQEGALTMLGRDRILKPLKKNLRWKSIEKNTSGLKNPELNGFTWGIKAPAFSMQRLSRGDAGIILLASKRAKEIKRATFSINPSKAPGEDGLTGLFFQKQWNIIGTDICAAILEFFQNGKMIRSINHTVITLVPKVKQVQTMKDLHPIGLCNVLYKIIFKILTSRLQPFMNAIIGDEQSAFTKGQLIFDNILLGHELMHSLRLRKQGKKYGMALKLDISKAYECVKWQYLQHMLQVFGFNDYWTKWIMESNKQTFDELREQIRHKLAGWKEQLLSKGGREVLIKAVAQAIPIYAMSCFKLPVILCNEINSLMANFWWGQHKEEAKLHLVTWKNMCEPKRQGGLGFRDLQAFNMPIVAKQGWRILSKPNSLLARVLKVRYFPHTSFLQAKAGSKPSSGWRNIL
ncbi:uncharacterized protein LOC131171138 [Hevea brasiliensis]|uniref:uncharacterized protein LOC131171138 n=1 Tax=Hevea brasiliensis TaxID=3981 RepID=UPI0025EC8EF1|nr:uncharacterized protein LOC131171138 [Hevea brasiliensis]